MKSSRFNRFLVSSFPRFLAATVVCVTSAAYADIATKSGTGTNLVDAASWSGGSGPGFPTSADVATWNNSSLGAGLIVDSAVNWGSIDITGALTNISITGAGAITTGNITLTGDKTLSIANNIILSGNSIYNIADVTGSTTADATLSGAISGTFDITKSGAGTLQFGGLLGGGAYANNLAVNAGTLILTNPGAQTLSGVISGSGTLTLKTPAGTGAAGSVTIGGASSNTFKGTLNIDSNGNTNSTFRTITFNKTGGAVAIGDNAVINFGVGTTGQTNLRMGASNQFGSGVVINFGNVVGQYGRFDLMGTSQTLAGINAGTVATRMGAVIQNRELNNTTANRGTSTLTLNGDGTYLYNGWMRDSDNGVSATNQLALVKNGAGTQTLVGDQITYTGATTINDGTLVLHNTTAFGSNITLGASNTPTLQLDGTWSLARTISGGSANASVEKIGTGTVTLTAANTYTGGTIVSGGTLALNYTTQNNDKIASNSSLTFGGGSLSVTGHASAATTQSVAGTTLNPGAATITVTKNASTQDTTLNLNTITRNAGGTMNVVYAGTGAGTASVTTDNLNDATGILGGWATVGGSDWAINSTGAADGRITAYTGYSATLVGTAMSDTLNQRLTGNLTLTGAHTHNSLKIENSTASQSLALGTNLLTLNSGGLLVTGTNAYTISGTAGATRLTAGNGSGAYDLIVHQYNTGGLTISAVIGDNGGNATNLIKAGTGTLTLTGENTYTGTTTIGAGTLQIGNNGTTGNLSAGAVMNHGTLVFNRSDFITIDNVISGTGALTKQGAGTLTLTGANTYTGTTSINGGTLALSGGDNRLSTATTMAFTGSSTLDIGNTTQSVAGFSMSDTAGINKVGVITGSGGTLNVTGGAEIRIGSRNFGDSGHVNNSLSIDNVTVNFTPTLVVGRNYSGNSSTSGTGSLIIGANSVVNASALVIADTNYQSGAQAPVGSGTLTINGGSLKVATLTLSRSNRNNAPTNSTVNLNDGGTLRVQTISPQTTGQETINFNWNGGTIRNYDADTDLTIGAGMTNFKLLGAGPHTFDIDGGRQGTVSQVMSDSGALTKAGAGTLILNAANIYAGITTVEQGTLSLGASGTISSTLVLGSDDGDLGSLDVTLKGSFSQANVSGSGTLSIGAGKTITVTTELAPGFSPGILTVDGNLALVDSDDSTTVTKMELAGNGGVFGVDSDYVDVTGSFTLAGLLEIISIDGYDLAQVGTYNLFDAASFTGSFASVTVDGQSLGNFADNTWSASYDNYTYSFNQSDGVLTVIPEPAAILLGGLGMLTLLRRRRN